MNTEKIFFQLCYLNTSILSWPLVFLSQLPSPNVLPGITKIGSLLSLYNSSDNKM